MSEETKQCTKCKRVKPLSEFGKHKSTKDGYTYRCLQCKRDYATERRQTPEGIYDAMKGVNKFYHRREIIISKEDFVDWYKEIDKHCAYCDIPEENIIDMQELFPMRANRLTVDCMDNDKGYVRENMVLACGLCNLIKNNLFTYDEMRDIAQRHIKPKWRNLLYSNGKL